ncbi:hypothetical protein VTK73DRAFT_2478 [Phialemonium thermophilum]|uniref:Uncharacterized protein n=1 Tax=Phialemonium thermophilum TaxID=223376 RepID=A0ABR3Y1F2_9PEZI
MQRQCYLSVSLHSRLPMFVRESRPAAILDACTFHRGKIGVDRGEDGFGLRSLMLLLNPRSSKTGWLMGG